jgi:hypothetical protein
VLQDHELGAGDPRAIASAPSTEHVRSSRGSTGVAEHGVGFEPERRGERVDVAGVLRERPGLGRRRIGAPLRAIVDERVEPATEHRVVDAGAAVQCDQRELAGAALLNVEAGVADVHEHGGRDLICA